MTMDNFGGFLKKAVYLGVGLASYAGEKAGDRFTEIIQEAQQKAEELVRRGEMTTEEAKRFVDSILENAQAPAAPTQDSQSSSPPEPRTIDIVVEDSEP
ncbi:MAG: phasin family protein [Prochlorotrichaceae cyanobacterium]|jgi:polyhydroxyalkanoate synthesis regulator phasin